MSLIALVSALASGSCARVAALVRQTSAPARVERRALGVHPPREGAGREACGGARTCLVWDRDDTEPPSLPVTWRCGRPSVIGGPATASSPTERGAERGLRRRTAPPW